MSLTLLRTMISRDHLNLKYRDQDALIRSGPLWPLQVAFPQLGLGLNRMGGLHLFVCRG